MIPSNIVPVLEEMKFFIAFGGALWSFFTAYNYLKTAFTSTQSGLDTIKTELKEQTTALIKANDAQTNEMRTMSAHMQLVIQALIVPPAPARARAARARRKK
jgi:hypothetical protein